MSRAALIGALLVTGACKLAAGGTPWSAGGTPSPPSSSRSSPPPPPITEPDRATAPDYAARATYVSTKQSAARLNGLPGMTCEPQAEEQARRAGLQGPCWDPPGSTRAIPAAHLQPGMREMRAPDFKMLAPDAVYWFDMPREAKLDPDGTPRLPSHDGTTIRYTPYGTQGFRRGTLPPLVGRPLREALAAIDAMDMPYDVLVEYRECAAAHDAVCSVTEHPSGADVTLRVSMRIKYRDTPNEQRWIPDKLEGRVTADVVAELKKLGFTNVVVVEQDLPCERGVVCSMYRPGWHPTNQLIEVAVRRAAKQP